jgi:multiple sugar transport system substrate-binding protein
MNFLDRDCRNDFAGDTVAPAIQSFLKNPKDINKIVESMDEAWAALPTLS